MSLYSQVDELFIPHDDGSISNKPITCMYNGYKNKISFSYRGSQIINITSNNGRVIKDTTFHIANYYIIPKNNLDIKVNAIIALYRDHKWDTIQVSRSFCSLSPPKVRIIVDKDLFRKKKLILLSLVDSSTGLSIFSRYKIGRLGYVTVFDEKHNKVGTMDLLNNGIDFSLWHFFSDKIIKSGYTIEPFYPIRDTVTDLLSDTEPFSYIIE
jgi:hypothetical protein